MSRAVTKLNPERPLILSELRFLRLTLEGKSPGEAAILAGVVPQDSHPSDAAMIGAQLLEEIQPALRSMMSATGLSDQFVIAEIFAGMKATVQRVVWAEGDNIFSNGKRYESIDTGVPDWRVRRAYTRLASQIKMLLFQSELDKEDENATDRRSALARAHRVSLVGKSDDELNKMIEEEALGRQRVRTALS